MDVKRKRGSWSPESRRISSTFVCKRVCQCGPTVSARRPSRSALTLLRGQNTTLLSYELIDGTGPLRLELQPWVNFRPHEGVLQGSVDEPHTMSVQGYRYELERAGYPALRFTIAGATPTFTIVGGRLTNVRYQIEESRGYDSTGDLYSPGFFTVELAEGASVSFLASTEPWEVALAVPLERAMGLEQKRRTRLVRRAHPSLGVGAGAELVLAADQFVITPAGRLADAARARAGATRSAR